MKLFIILTILTIVLGVNLSPYKIFAQEQTEYTLLAPLEGYVENTTTAGPYIIGIFNLIIALAGGLAVLKIIYGGIQYMSTDAFGAKNEAKDTIKNAIWGLLLAISAWLILYTVNPNLVEINLDIPRQGINPDGGGGR